jgi:hypothetical protein
MGIRRASALVPGFSVTKPPHAMVLGLDATDYSTGVALAASTWTASSWSKVVTDTDGWWDTTNEDFTPTFTGLYIGYVQMKWNADEFSQFRLYDVTGTAVLFEYGPYSVDRGGRSSQWHYQWWMTGGNAYTIDLYNWTASTYYADSYMMLTGPYVTEG